MLDDSSRVPIAAPFINVVTGSVGIFQSPKIKERTVNGM